MHRLSFLLTLLAASSGFAAEDVVLRTKVKTVDVEILIPKEARPVRGLLVHVFNYKLKTHDRNATLCRELKWAHVNTIISRKENNRPTKIREALKVALAEFAEKTGRPELVHVPRTGTGFSAGGMVTKVLETEPERMLTNAISCSWVREAGSMGEAASVPELFIIGAEPDGFEMLPAIEKFYEPAVAEGRPWALGLQHGCKHDWSNSGTLSAVWIKSIADLRYPEKVDPTKPIPLRPVSFDEGWRGDRTTIDGTCATIAPAAEFKGDPKLVTWLPDRATAYVWRAWQTKKSPVDLTAKTTDGGKELPAFNPRKSFGMSLPPRTSLVLGVNPKQDLAITKVTYYDADQVIGESTAAPWTIEWTADDVGCHAVWAEYEVSGKRAATNPALFCFEPAE